MRSQHGICVGEEFGFGDGSVFFLIYVIDWMGNRSAFFLTHALGFGLEGNKIGTEWDGMENRMENRMENSIGWKRT